MSGELLVVIAGCIIAAVEILKKGSLQASAISLVAVALVIGALKI